jgi:hypothetical protein
MCSVGLLSVKPGIVRRQDFARALAEALDGNELLVTERSGALTLDGRVVLDALVASKDTHSAAIDGLFDRLDRSLASSSQNQGFGVAGSYASDFFYLLSQSKVDAQLLLMRLLDRSPNPAAGDYAKTAWQQLGGQTGFPTDEALASMDPDQWERACLMLAMRAREQKGSALPGGAESDRSADVSSDVLAAVRSVFWTVQVQRDAAKRLADNAISHNRVSDAVSVARNLPKAWLREHFYRSLWDDQRVRRGPCREVVLRALLEDSNPSVQQLYETFNAPAPK